MPQLMRFGPIAIDANRILAIHAIKGSTLRIQKIEFYTDFDLAKALEATFTIDEQSADTRKLWEAITKGCLANLHVLDRWAINLGRVCSVEFARDCGSAKVRFQIADEVSAAIKIEDNKCRDLRKGIPDALGEQKSP